MAVDQARPIATVHRPGVQSRCSIVVYCYYTTACYSCRATRVLRHITVNVHQRSCTISPVAPLSTVSCVDFNKLLLPGTGRFPALRNVRTGVLACMITSSDAVCSYDATTK